MEDFYDVKWCNVRLSCVYKLCMAVNCCLLPVYIAKNHVNGHAVLTDVVASTRDGAAPSLEMEVELRV
jgi:hypothetical protein